MRSREARSGSAPEHELLEMGARRMRLERRLIDVALEEEERSGSSGSRCASYCSIPARPARAASTAASSSATASLSPSRATHVTARTTVISWQRRNGCASIGPTPRRACDPRGRSRRVPRADGIDQLDVPLGGLRGIHVGAVQRDRDPALDAERLPALLEHRVPRCLDDQPMEGDVVLDERLRVVPLTAFFIASSSTSRALTSPPRLTVARRAASSSSEARTG